MGQRCARHWNGRESAQEENEVLRLRKLVSDLRKQSMRRVVLLSDLEHAASYFHLKLDQKHSLAQEQAALLILQNSALEKLRADLEGMRGKVQQAGCRDGEKQVQELKQSVECLRERFRQGAAEVNQSRCLNEEMQARGRELEIKLTSLREECGQIGREQEVQAVIIQQGLARLKALDSEILKAEALKNKAEGAARILEQQKERLKGSAGTAGPRQAARLQRQINETMRCSEDLKVKVGSLQAIIAARKEELDKAKLLSEAERERGDELMNQWLRLESAIEEGQTKREEGEQKEERMRRRIFELQEKVGELRRELECCGAVEREAQCLNRELMSEIEWFVRASEEMRDMLSRKVISGAQALGAITRAI